MPAIIPEEQNNTSFITVDFILRADRQHALIHCLKNYTSLNTEKLARLLNISTEKLTAVSEKRDFLNQKSSSEWNIASFHNFR